MTKAAAILGVVNAGIALLIAFGVTVSQDQQAAIVAITNAMIVLVIALLDPKVPLGKQD